MRSPRPSPNAATSLGLPREPRVPAQLLLRYGPATLVASGGFGAVFSAIHLQLGRKDAIKVLLADTLDDEDQVRRFQDEARITVSISHPHVVQIFDHGIEEGVPFIVYEFLSGGNLRDLLSEGPLDPMQACAFGAQVALGLAEAHSKGILHRDVKPENVLLTDLGLCKVTDFGIARWSRDRAVKTATGLVLGTPAYMAPEQIRGTEPGPASDVYALGVMLFELVTGQLPFESDSVSSLLAGHLTESPPRLRAMRPGVDPRIDDLVALLLSKDPTRRPTARELAGQLARIVPGTYDVGTVRRTPDPFAQSGTERSGPSPSTPAPKEPSKAPTRRIKAVRALETTVLKQEVHGGRRRAPFAILGLAVLGVVGALASLGPHLVPPSIRSPVPALAARALSPPSFEFGRRAIVSLPADIPTTARIEFEPETGSPVAGHIADGRGTIIALPGRTSGRVLVRGGESRILASTERFTTPRPNGLAGLEVYPLSDGVVVTTPRPDGVNLLVKVTYRGSPRGNPEPMPSVPGRSGWCVTGLSSSRDYEVTVSSDHPWVGSGPVRFQTLDAGGRVRVLRYIAATKVGHISSAISSESLPGYPDPRLAPDIQREWVRDEHNGNTLHRYFIGYAINSMSASLIDRLAGHLECGFPAKPHKPVLRSRILDGLEVMSHPERVSLARNQLHRSTDPDNAFSVIRAAAAICLPTGNPQDTARVLDLLDQHRNEGWHTIGRSIARGHGPTWRPRIRSWIQDGSREADEAILAGLIAVLYDPKRPDLGQLDCRLGSRRGAAPEQIMEVWAQRALEGGQEKLHETSKVPGLQALALGYAARMPSPTTWLALANTLVGNSAPREHRRGALILLSRSPEPAHRAAIRATIGDSDEAIADVASWIAGWRRDSQAIPALVKRAAAGPDHMGAALDALGQFDDPAAGQVVKDIVRRALEGPATDDNALRAGIGSWSLARRSSADTLLDPGDRLRPVATHPFMTILAVQYKHWRATMTSLTRIGRVPYVISLPSFIPFVPTDVHCESGDELEVSVFGSWLRASKAGKCIEAGGEGLDQETGLTMSPTLMHGMSNHELESNPSRFVAGSDGPVSLSAWHRGMLGSFPRPAWDRAPQGLAVVVLAR